MTCRNMLPSGNRPQWGSRRKDGTVLFRDRGEFLRYVDAAVHRGEDPDPARAEVAQIVLGFTSAAQAVVWALDELLLASDSRNAWRYRSPIIRWLHKAAMYDEQWAIERIAVKWSDYWSERRHQDPISAAEAQYWML